MTTYRFDQRIAEIYRHSKEYQKRQIAGFDIRAAQSDVLLFINDHPRLTQLKIAQAMALDPSLLAKDLKMLSNKGWIKREVLPSDRRARVITMTASGTELVAKLHENMDEWWDRLFQNNPEIDQAVLARELDKVYQGLEESN